MPTNALTSVREAFPSVFDDFFRPWNDWFENGNRKTLTVPAVNITEQDHTYKATLAVPGMTKDDFYIDITGDVLTISAEQEEENEEEEKNYTRQEYNYSSFSRSFTIPADVNKADIQASYNNGLLEVMLPKKEAAKNVNSTRVAVN